jgi:hypothetical protein
MTGEKTAGDNARDGQESRRQNDSSRPARKFLFVSEIGLIGDLAYTVRNEGNEVRYHIHSKADKDISDGCSSRKLMTGNPQGIGLMSSSLTT